MLRVGSGFAGDLVVDGLLVQLYVKLAIPGSRVASVPMCGLARTGVGILLLVRAFDGCESGKRFKALDDAL